MERNYSMMLKQMQMAFMPITMKNQKEEEVCMFCWSSGCDCHANKVKDDSFLSLTTVSEFKYA